MSTPQTVEQEDLAAKWIMHGNYEPRPSWVYKAFMSPRHTGKPREISAKRARKLRKRGEYCWFVRWTPSGKCRYAWGGKVPDYFTFWMPRRT